MRRWSLVQFSAVRSEATALHIPNCFSDHVIRCPPPPTRWGLVPTNGGRVATGAFPGEMQGLWQGLGGGAGAVGPGEGGRSSLVTGACLNVQGVRRSALLQSLKTQVRDVRRKEGKWRDGSWSRSVAKLGLGGAFPLCRLMPVVQMNGFQCAKSCLY